MLQKKIAENFPGTKLSISEYNYGGGGDISGGIAEADVLGIFARMGVFSANEWPLVPNEPFIAGAGDVPQLRWPEGFIRRHFNFRGHR